MGNVSKIRNALARRRRSAGERRSTKRAVKAQRKVSRNTPGPGSTTSPGMYGIGAPDRFGGSSL